ncbi:MAG: PLP-dependent aminotransferase family protein [Oscillospiraceae bacterium]|nr:PLP-dependent aminotransferase family protein [Oscillospiraceae bacterium]
MKYIIDKEKRPVYLQIYNLIRDDILNEILPFNSKLPSIRILAEELTISTITVEHAYALLCDEGYIEARERSGYFVIFRADDGFVSAPTSNIIRRVQPSNHIETNTDFPFSVLAKTMRKVISDAGEGMLERSPNLGTLELREAIRTYLAQNRGILADTEQIIIGSGSEHLYTLLVELLGSERVYAIESPSYKKIEQVYKASDVRLEKLPLTLAGIDSATLKNCSADILHISPYRSYPSGVTATASKRHEYLRWAEQGKRYIIEDDFESEFSVSRKPEETLFSHSLRDNVIYMNTFSKTVSPSFRIGYMVLPKALAKEYEEKLGFLSCTVPTYLQLVLAELITNGDFERHINRVRRLKRKQTN